MFNRHGWSKFGRPRQLSVVQLTFALPAAAMPNGCLVAVSVSSPANGHRRQPLQSGQLDLGKVVTIFGFDHTTPLFDLMRDALHQLFGEAS
jgi:hypothetical protein